VLSAAGCWGSGYRGNGVAAKDAQKASEPSGKSNLNNFIEFPFILFLLLTYSIKRVTRVGIPGQGGRDSEIDPVSIPKLIRSRFRDEVGQGFRF
jgi:hypothetical protein